MRIIIAGGGTGGHIFPAISVAEEFLRRDRENEILFVGTRRGMEGRILPKLGYRLEFISSGGIAGRGVGKILLSSASALKGVFQSVGIIRKFKPDAVVGAGGYVSGPMVLAAWGLWIPTAICEQNSIPGIANRILGKFAKRVFAAFEESRKFFPADKISVTGNPVRGSIAVGKRERKSEGGRFNILVFGGSQGAATLNASVPKGITLLDRGEVFVRHQTGERDLEETRRIYKESGVESEVSAFIDDMAEAYAKADLVVGRAGAGTIAEITAMGIASILVPYPFAANNHQLENALSVAKLGAAAVIEDRDATPERFAETLRQLLEGDRLKEMAERSKELGKPFAARDIVDGIYKLARRGD